MRKALFLLAACLGFAGCAPTARQALGPELARARAAGAPVLIYALGVPGQVETSSSQLAVPVYIQFVVTSRDPIGNIRFTFAAYSQRGNAVIAHDGNRMGLLLVGPGPFDPNHNYEVNTFHSTPAGFPGGSVACVSLQKMEITFVDGEHETYGPESLPPALMPPLRRGCDDQGIVVDDMLIEHH